MSLSTDIARMRERLGEAVPLAGCPSRILLSHVTSKWGVLVLVALADGTMRWSELRRAVSGISEKMLAQTLDTLEGDGLVHREARPVLPPHVEYRLTPLGLDLVERLVPLVQWAIDHALPAPDELVDGPTARQVVGNVN